MISKEQIEQFLNDPKENAEFDKQRPLQEINTMAVIPGTHFMSFTCPDCGAWNSLVTNKPITRIKCGMCRVNFQYIKK